ncbi:MAG: CoA-binding protein [Chitinophagaceae bacterium]
MINKKTLVLGASDNPERYSYKAIKLLQLKGHDVVAVGRKETQVDAIKVVKNFPSNEKVHTVTLYLNPAAQAEYISSIIALAPERVIFNPGTENEDFAQELMVNGIDPVEACTLVMLSTGQF